MGGCCSKDKDIGNDISDSGSSDAIITPQEIYLSQRRLYSFSDFMDSGSPVLKDYKFINEIGSGALSRVYQIVSLKDNEILAAKVYDNQRISRPTLTGEDPPYVSIQRELDIMAKLDHRYVISLIDAFNDENTNSLIIIIPFAPLGNVKTLLDKRALNSDQLNACFHQVAIALAYMHSMNVVHRDIKPENMLAFTEDYFAITDLSVSQEVESDETMVMDIKGSPAFLSPEECAGTEFIPKPADVWAYGISLFSCYFGYFPFSIDECDGLPIGNTILMVTEKLNEKELNIPDGTSSDLIDLLTHVLDKDPTKRYTFEQIANHSFFEQSRHIDEENAKECFLEEEQEKQN
ncbi:AGC family protein kinase [Trichomonas vaginalis G3]|uniref:AGC family protein kinase n=1 Tax=Trichomonas vaginalis (strain ATCC PRA-98 / G3) TaxID=412133 RepID=A2DZS4_TRIV3|nr:peptidyl-threonine phosphorylation [Trichomonas vaginalis G3]EAY14142.1 AGC family protein kinase [Trichomonas vaginalis G3]KAI5525152.1 peptidyl-threonine phosphorylation [Trichomonas vaginalis G3]|eukprot:XP_001326365.1 AGC family protein kinase [Trichomonas vaginalis G3]